MPTKTFSIYGPGGETGTNPGDQLVVEIGKEHFACIIRNVDRSSILSFELFRYTADEANDFETLLSDLVTKSSLLGKQFDSVEAYINNELAVLVPAFKFNKEIAEDYLQIMFGPDGTTTRSYDYIPADSEMMNVFRIPTLWMEQLERKLGAVKFKHSYSKTIEAALTSEHTNETVFVQFYHHHIIVCAMQGNKLCLVQSFQYESQEDVLYHLLNTSNQLLFTGKDLSLHISGMIDLRSTLYNELVKYFEHVHVDTISPSVMGVQVHDHPPYYFTPFFKLAL